MTQITTLQQLQTLKTEFNNAIDQLIIKETEIIRLNDEAEKQQAKIIELEAEKIENEKNDFIFHYFSIMWVYIIRPKI